MPSTALASSTPSSGSPARERRLHRRLRPALLGARARAEHRRRRRPHPPRARCRRRADHDARSERHDGAEAAVANRKSAKRSQSPDARRLPRARARDRRLAAAGIGGGGAPGGGRAAPPPRPPPPPPPPRRPPPPPEPHLPGRAPRRPTA